MSEFALVRLVRSIVSGEVTRLEQSTGDGTVVVVEGGKASVRLAGPTSTPIPGFAFPPSLDVQPGDHVTVYKRAGYQLLTAVLNRNALVPAVHTHDPVVTLCRKIADETFAVTALADSAGMSIAVEPGTYLFEFVVFFTTSAPTEGVRLSVNGPTSSAIRWGVLNPAGAVAAGNLVGMTQSAAWDAEPVVFTEGPGTAGAMALLHGSFVATAAGTLVLRHGSETANNTTILAGSWGRVTQVA